MKIIIVSLDKLSGCVGCFFEIDFVKHKNEKEPWFLKIGYPERVIDNEMKKVKFNHCYFNGKQNFLKKVSPGNCVPSIA